MAQLNLYLGLPVFCILTWVTDPWRLTERVKSPGEERDGRAKKEPSTPLSNSRRSASTPEMFGWNHLQLKKLSTNLIYAFS